MTLATCDGVVKEEEVKTKKGKSLKVSIIDSTKTASSSQQHSSARLDGFFDSIIMDNVYLAVKELVSELVSNVMQEQVADLKTEVIEEARDELEDLSLSEKREVSLFMDVLTDTNPMMATEMLKTSVEALMQIQRAKKGQELLGN